MPLASPSSENMLTGRRIVLGITGSIAAYKSALLARELRRRGAEVRVVMTQGACEFITPLTMQALSGHPVHTDLLDPACKWPCSRSEHVILLGEQIRVPSANYAI